MKTLITLVLITLSLNISSQISIGEQVDTETIGTINKPNQYISVSRIEDRYYFMFQDSEYQAITVIKHFNIPDIESLDFLYEVITKDLNSKLDSDFERVINLPDGTLYINYYKGKYFRFSVSIYGQGYCTSSYINKKYLPILFGKLD